MLHGDFSVDGEWGFDQRIIMPDRYRDVV